MQKITDLAGYIQTDNHIHVQLSSTHRILSSAVLNGGLVEADNLLNLKVPKHSDTIEPPQQTLMNHCERNNLTGTTVGMMTAASMLSFQLKREKVQGVDIAALVTTGLSNPRRAGDTAEYRSIGEEQIKAGTINIIVMTSARLTDAAMVEVLLVATEAKTAALQDAGILSPASGLIATGTGTDSAAVVSGLGPQTIGYCGKHVLFGEILGRLVTEAVAESIAWYRTNITEVATIATEEKKTRTVA